MSMWILVFTLLLVTVTGSTAYADSGRSSRRVDGCLLCHVHKRRVTIGRRIVVGRISCSGSGWEDVGRTGISTSAAWWCRSVHSSPGEVRIG